MKNIFVQYEDGCLPYEKVISALDDAFKLDIKCPIRHHHYLNVPNKKDATLLLMPAWLEGLYFGVKQVSVFPSNGEEGLPGLNSIYILSCAKTGLPLAQFDGNVITARRTAAAAALGAKYLSRPESKNLLVVGAGKVASQVIPAMATVRDLEEIKIYNIHEESAASLAEQVQKELNIKASVVSKEDLPSAVAWADIVSCATLSEEPMVLGEWVTPGTHIDLIGSFTPYMREVDDELMQKAQVFADFKAAALTETGDFISPIKSGSITEDHIIGDFLSLSRGQHAGRKAFKDPENDISVFKAVGSSIEDLATAMLWYDRA
ncbi:ornithine cyclodeaminase family protein [Marinomonas sp. 2405UD66-6]|uniref:ornithine cyclodeaminase family protein n=1 Tax=Marinomonas sp. 2405UD66-6 TaxID=3391834 RepID=UPI0039C9AC7B